MRTAEYTKPLKEKYENLQNQVQECTRNMVNSTDEYVHENPWTTIGIAAAAALAIGLVVGLALSRD
jgi:ElaB/YqjD/DUF883 family membrane-anchored ribosome-binding protein